LVTSSYDAAPPSGNYRVKWRGKISEETPFPSIMKQVEAGELGMMSQILVNDQWLTIRDFLAKHKQAEAIRIAGERRRAEEEKAQRLAEERRRAEEEKARRLAQEKAAEQKRIAAEEKQLAKQAGAQSMQSIHAAGQRPVGSGFVFCRQCGNQVLPTAAICMKCGSPIGRTLAGVADANFASPAKSRVAYVLLALFLGFLGIHNFYAGYAGRGVVQLLMCLFGWKFEFIPWIILFFWTILEMFIVTEDANGQPFA